MREQAEWWRVVGTEGITPQYLTKDGDNLRSFVACKDRLNALEAQVATLQQQVTAAEAKAALAKSLVRYTQHVGACSEALLRNDGRKCFCGLRDVLERFALTSPDTGSGHEYRPSSDLINSPCAICRQRPDDHDDTGSEEG